MKLVFCTKCEDVVRLMDDYRLCKCGQSGGRYIDDVVAVYFGKHAMPLGFDNPSLCRALKNQPPQNAPSGEYFEAFVIPKECLSFGKIKRPNELRRR